MDKYFKESDVMAVLNKELMYCPLDCEWLVRHIIVSMSSLKPANVKPVVRGEWTPAENSPAKNPFLHCSECGRVVPIYESFCPDCGADMNKPSKEGI